MSFPLRKCGEAYAELDKPSGPSIVDLMGIYILLDFELRFVQFTGVDGGAGAPKLPFAQFSAGGFNGFLLISRGLRQTEDWAVPSLG